MTLGELYNAVLAGLGKDQYGGYVPVGAGLNNSFPDIINTVIQPDIMNAYTKKYEETRQLSVDIRPFIKTLGDPSNPPLPLVPWSANSKFSYAQFPSDFWYFSDGQAAEFVNQCGQMSQVYYHSLEWVDRARWDYLTTQKRQFPTKRFPIASIQNEQIVVCPALTRAVFTYLRKPLNIVFDYEIVTGSTVVYLPPGSVHTNTSTAPIGTPSTSVELEWPDSVHNEFMTRGIQWYGRNIQNPVDMNMPSKKP